LKLINVVILGLWLVSLSNTALANLLDPDLSSEFDPQPEFIDITPQENLDEFTSNKSDAEILQSLDDINEQLNNEILTIEQQHLPSTLNEQDKELIDPEMTQQDIINEKLLLAEDMLGSDNFDDLNIDEALDIDEILNTDINEELSPTLKPENTKNKFHQLKPSFELGVGVKGKEEELINTLDKSDLMDFEEKIDVWSEDVVEDIDIE
jgi:hypothetical protein